MTLRDGLRTREQLPIQLVTGVILVIGNLIYQTSVCLELSDRDNT